MTEEDCIEVYTDGSCSTNTLAGGWAFVMQYGGRQLHRFGHEHPTTINAMELMAIQRGLQQVALNAIPLKIVSDSEYSIKALSLWHIRWAAQGWVTSNGDPVKNAEIIIGTLALLREHRKHRKVSIVWARGHSGVVGNEFADKLAHRARVERITNWSDNSLDTEESP